MHWSLNKQLFIIKPICGLFILIYMYSFQKTINKFCVFSFCSLLFEKVSKLLHKKLLRDLWRIFWCYGFLHVALLWVFLSPIHMNMLLKARTVKIKFWWSIVVQIKHRFKSSFCVLSVVCSTKIEAETHPHDKTVFG